MAVRTFEDETLGTLTWNDSLDWWEGQVEFSPGRTIGLSISVEEDEAGVEPTAEVQRARVIVDKIREHEPDARRLAADELLDIYNEEWNDGEALDEEEFAERLTLDDLSVSFDGSAELFYRDGGLFAGHTVLVTMDTDGRFESADITG